MVMLFVNCYSFKCLNKLEDNDGCITKTSLCDEDPLTPHFYIVKLGFCNRGIHYYLIFALKHRLWVLVRIASLRRF